MDFIVIDDERTFTNKGLRDAANGPFRHDMIVDYCRTSDEGLRRGPSVRI